MAFLLTVIYIALALLSPADLMPALAVFRPELIIGLLALFFSIPEILSGRILRGPQVYLLAGLLPAVLLSQVLGGGWLSGGFAALKGFLPVVLVFVLVSLNCNSLKRLKTLTAVLAVIAAGLVIQGGIAYFAGDQASPFLLSGRAASGELMYRIRGLGVLHDPNDLAQLLALVIPFAWLLWDDKQKLYSSAVVIYLTMFLMGGVYLTHSRGGVIAILVVMLFGLKEKLGMVRAVLSSALAAAGLFLLNFSGGRSISMGGGEDRLQIWSNGLQFFKSSPVFGIGAGNFVNLNDGFTAHNSFILCLAELGIFGYLLWVGLLVATIAGLNQCIAQNELPAEGPTQGGDEQADLVRWAKALRVSLLGFIAAACFLSRTYAFLLYLILGMAAAICWLPMAHRQPVAEHSFGWLAMRTALAGSGAIVFVYLLLRLRSVA